jgi:transcriptional regulator with XRE-family HTH domain
MTALRRSNELRQERLERDPAFRSAWERTALARAVALRVLGYRIEHHLTQTALARRLGLQQPAIARLELGERNPSVETLRLLAEVLGMEFLVHVSPATSQPHWADPEPTEDTVLERVRGERSAVVALAR